MPFASNLSVSGFSTGFGPLAESLGMVLLLGAYFFAGLLLYSARRVVKGPFRDAEIETRGKTALIGMGPRHFFAWVMAPLWRGLLKLEVPPNAITVLSVLIAIAAGCALAAGEFTLGGWLYLFAGACDFIDGRLARESGRAGPAGAAFDSVLDRYAEAAVFVGLAWYYRDSWILIAVLFALNGSHLVPYVRARGEGLGVEVKVGIMQRPERLAIIGISCVFSPLIDAWIGEFGPHPARWLAVLGILSLAVTTPLTALTRLRHVMHALSPEPPVRRSPLGVGGIGRNAVAGLVATLSDFLLVLTLLRQGVPPWAATFLGCVLGGVVNFLVNRIWTFESRGPAGHQALRYALVSGSSALLNAGGVAALLLLPGFEALWAWAIARGLTFVTWNYPLHRDYVYAPERPREVPRTSERGS